MNLYIYKYNKHRATEKPNNNRTNNDKDSLSHCLGFIEILAS